jgi:hypothetical protein
MNAVLASSIKGRISMIKKKNEEKEAKKLAKGIKVHQEQLSGLFQFERKDSKKMMDNIAEENDWFDPEIAHEQVKTNLVR